MVNKRITEQEVFDCIFHGVFALCLLFAIYLYDEDSLNQKNYHLINKSIYSRFDNDGRGAVGGINFTSTVFGAQNNITIAIMLTPSNVFVQSHPDEIAKIQQIYVYLPEATTGDEKFFNGIEYSPIRTLQPDLNKYGYFSGTFNLKYSEEGEKCIRFSLDLRSDEPNHCQPDEEPMIKISSADSTLQYNNNKLVSALTWVLIAFSVVSAREPLSQMYSKYRNR